MLTLPLCILHNGRHRKATTTGSTLLKKLMFSNVAMVSQYGIDLIPHLLTFSLAVEGNQPESLESGTDNHQSQQHESSPVYDDADADDEFFEFLRSNPVQQGSHNGPAGVHDGRVAYADEPRFINQLGFGRHGSKDQPIELDDLEEELDDALEFTDNLSSNRSYQSVHVNSSVGANHPGTVPVASNVHILALGASGQKNQQWMQSSGALHGPTYPQQVQSSAVARPSDAELAKNHADKKVNKAKEIAFKDQGRWWHRMNGNVAAGMEVPSFDRAIKTDILTVPAVQHSEIANQLRTTANSRGSYRKSYLLNRLSGKSC